MLGRPRKSPFAAVVAACLILAGSIASPHSMTVPFFRDEGSAIGENGPQTGAAGMITVTNTTTQPVTMYLVYTHNDVSGGATYQQAVPHTVGAKRTIQWRPVQNDPAEGSGQSVPNTLPGSGNFGSVSIYWIGGDEMTGALIGRYQEFTRDRSMMHVLVEERGGGS